MCPAHGAEPFAHYGCRNLRRIEDPNLPRYRWPIRVDSTEDGLAIEVALSASMLATNSTLTWKYSVQIGLAVRGSKHNRARDLIAEMARHFPRVWSLAQNIGGFPRNTGSKNLIEAHGNMPSLSCTRCSFFVAIDEFHGLDIHEKCVRDLGGSMPSP